MKERRRNGNHFRHQMIWCDQCCLRIAPYEERVVVAERPYHSACYHRVVQTKRPNQKDAA